MLVLIFLVLIWIGLGFSGNIYIAGHYPQFAQNGILDFLICYFLVSFINRKLFIGGRMGSKNYTGKFAIIACLVIVIILVSWGLYFGYFDNLNLKYFVIAFVSMLAYTWILIQILYRIGDYSKTISNSTTTKTK